MTLTSRDIGAIRGSRPWTAHVTASLGPARAPKTSDDYTVPLPTDSLLTMCLPHYLARRRVT